MGERVSIALELGGMANVVCGIVGLCVVLRATCHLLCVARAAQQVPCLALRSGGELFTFVLNDSVACLFD